MSELLADENKRKVGEFSVEKFVTSNMTIGLGSGSTAIWAMRAIAHKCKEGILTNIMCGSTGPGTQLEALSLGLSVHDLNFPALVEFDIVIDGADEFDDNSNLVKGGGGCLLREKIVGYSADKFVILVGEEKQVPYLGKTFPIPIEVIPSALKRVEKQIVQWYDVKTINLRKDARNVGPWITEEGNYLLDIVFGQEYNPKNLELEIVQIVGIVEVGIFAQHKPIIMIIQKNGKILIKNNN